MFLLLACAHPAPPPSIPTSPPAPVLRPKECTALLGIGELRRAGAEKDEAALTWTEGYARCGPGYGFLGRLAGLQVDTDADAAVLLAARELMEPGPFGASVHLVVSNWGRLREQTQATVRALGADEQAPLRMPDLGAAMAWTRTVVCGGQEPTLAPRPAGDGRNLTLGAACGGAEHTRFFVLREPDVPPASP